MSYRMNYKGVAESGNFEPIPEGKYAVIIDKIEEKYTKKSGLPLIKVRYKVTIDEYKGRILFDQITLFESGDKGAGITKHFLHMIGEPYDGEFEVDPERWIGKELVVKVIIDKEYDNNKIRGHEEMDSIPF